MEGAYSGGRHRPDPLYRHCEWYSLIFLEIDIQRKFRTFEVKARVILIGLLDN